MLRSLVGSEMCIRDRSNAVQDLAITKNDQINPDDALIKILVLNADKENGILRIQAKVLNVNNVGFGFNDHLKTSDQILIIADNDIQVDPEDIISCVITKAIKPNTSKSEYKMVKLM